MRRPGARRGRHRRVTRGDGLLAGDRPGAALTELHIPQQRPAVGVNPVSLRGNCVNTAGAVPAGLRLVKVATLSQAVDDLEAIKQGKPAPSC